MKKSLSHILLTLQLNLDSGERNFNFAVIYL